MDDKIIGLYAAGLTVRDIQAHLLDLYGLKVSPDLISRVTDAVLDEVREWKSRALERMYPIVIFDALRVKIRDADSWTVKNKAVYVALGVTRDGLREVLGLWVAENEGAKFWLSVMNELKNRGTQDILIAIVDGLKGFPEAIMAAFPETMVQTYRECPGCLRLPVRASGSSRHISLQSRLRTRGANQVRAPVQVCWPTRYTSCGSCPRSPSGQIQASARP